MRYIAIIGEDFVDGDDDLEKLYDSLKEHAVSYDNNVEFEIYEFKEKVKATIKIEKIEKILYK